MTKNATWVTGLFTSRAAADRAVDAIVRAGYAQQEISMLVSNEAHARHFGPTTIQDRSNVGDGIGAGGLVGGSLGAILAAVAAAGSVIVFPGVGLVVAGPIAAALAGAGACAAAGGLVGAIVGAGIPEDRATFYEAGLRNGGIVLGVQARNKEEERKLENWLSDAGAERIRVS